MHVLDYSSPRLVLAMDHARNNGVITGLEDPGRIIDAALDAGVDAVEVERAVLGGVPALRHVLAPEAAPVGDGLAVEEQVPAFCLLLGCQRV